MEAALGALELLLDGRGWPVLSRDLRLDLTGPEALLVVDAKALELKGATVTLEDGHPLGRLWDMDVIDPDRGSISRRALKLPPRRCLLCGEAAHACARSRAHPLPELLGAIREKLSSWTSRA
jgi:holo-ACP synthase